jgi:hypothetical protein
VKLSTTDFTPRARVFKIEFASEDLTAYGRLELIQEAIHAVLVPVWKTLSYLLVKRKTFALQS